MGALNSNTVAGTSVYARITGIMAYSTPNPIDPAFDNVRTYKSDNIVWKAGELVGVYTGLSNTSGTTEFHEIEVLMYTKPPFVPFLGKKWSRKKVNFQYSPKSVKVWFKDSEISINAVLTDAEKTAADKKKEEDELAAQLKKILDETESTAAPKGFFASIFGPTVDPGTDLGGINRNTLIGIAGILILAIIGIVAYKRSKNKSVPQPPVYPTAPQPKPKK